MTPQPPTAMPQTADFAGVKNLIAVGSGKGGVGKTTVAVNLAVALGQLGYTTGLMDADVYGPNVPLMMGINQTPMALGERIQPLEQYGVKLMSMGFLNPGDKPLVWRGPMLHSVIQQFLRGVDWGDLDYLVIDLPPGTGDVQLSLIQTAPITGAIVVTTPSDVSLEDARKAVTMFHQVKVPVLGVVENMSFLIVPALPAADRRVQPRRRPAHGRADGGAFPGRTAARPARAHRRRHWKAGGPGPRRAGTLPRAGAQHRRARAGSGT
jgi:ATP-binding protein involved in chromosome partitioning